MNYKIPIKHSKLSCASYSFFLLDMIERANFSRCFSFCYCYGGQILNTTVKSLQVKRAEIWNLWGIESISLEFTKKVTFLTGTNGSGKSTLLNLLFDSLICNPRKFTNPSTSKNRFWASKLELVSLIENQKDEPDFSLSTLVLPHMNVDIIDKSEIEKIIRSTEDENFVTKLNKIKGIYENASLDEVLTYIGHDSDQKGEWWAKDFDVYDPSFSQEQIDMVNEEFQNRSPLGFLFQEDRTTLHNMDNCSVDRSSLYWGYYQSSIDERFAYIRDAIQMSESLLDNRFVKLISDRFKSEDKSVSDDLVAFFERPEVRSINKKRKELISLLDVLNKYFAGSGKKITRDHDNKFTLGKVKENLEDYSEKGFESDDDNLEPISWHLLSRGEKTLIYLFLATYYYKDKVSVFLLDEPEISFHVTWQKNLIKDLSDIAPDNQFIIATHSPSLVMNGWLQNCLELNVK